jgi:scyllo-inositol 2-dehydrogenase (NADP+)
MTASMMTPQAPDRPLGVALLGHGVAGAGFHAPLIEATPGLALRVIATSRPETLAARRPGPRPMADPREACEAADVDLVVVATPNDSHEALARMALEAGKHVLVDKPMALSAAAADRLVALAARQGRLLEVFHNRRFDGDFKAVQQLVAAGTLGDLRLFEGRWDRFRPQAAPGWRNTLAHGAGLLWDLGPHLLDQALCLFGTPDDFSADLAVQRPGSQADDYFELTLRYGPMRCVLSASMLVQAARPRFALHGSAGSWLSRGVDPQEAALRRGEAADGVDFRARLPRQQALHVDATGTPRSLAIEPGDWLSFYGALEQALRGSGPLPVGAAAGREVVALIEAAQASAR